MRKSLWFWLCFVAAIVLAVYFAVRIIMISLGHGSAATIKSISISSDFSGQNLSFIAAAASISPGTRTYSVNLDDINARIEAVPDVKTSAVRRLPNGSLAIKVKLHKAVALWTDGKHFYPLSADGTIIKRPIDHRPENTVVFRGALPTDIIGIAKTAHNLAPHLDYLEWIENRRWNIHTTGSATIMLPEQDPIASISALMIMDKNHQILSKKINILDMRDSARILVKQ
ncbi:MAG: cell division protein FtsQ/DivIB [Rickettsiales bacterium]|jgi:cell division septal protein FtsQ|nr:cell division protein FtsQ/DivIB [Rickettsiales bacterium]